MILRALILKLSVRVWYLFCCRLTSLLCLSSCCSSVPDGCCDCDWFMVIMPYHLAMDNTCTATVMLIWFGWSHWVYMELPIYPSVKYYTFLAVCWRRKDIHFRRTRFLFLFNAKLNWLILLICLLEMITITWCFEAWFTLLKILDWRLFCRLRSACHAGTHVL